MACCKYTKQSSVAGNVWVFSDRLLVEYRPAAFEENPLLSLAELRIQETKARRMVQQATIALRVQQALRFEREADRLFMLPGKYTSNMRDRETYRSIYGRWIFL